MQQGGGSLRWLKRLFSTQKQLSLPASVYELLQSAPVQVQKVAGQGRGLFAARDLEYGETVFSEQPYICIPALSKRKQVCYHCLKVLTQDKHADTRGSTQAAAVLTRGGAFCSQSCLAAANASYYQLESQINLGQLEQYCEAHGERFPLLAARLALMVAQQEMQSNTEQPMPEATAASAAAGKRLSSVSRLSTGSSGSMARSSLQASSWMSSGSQSSRKGAGATIGRLSARSSLDGHCNASQADPSAALSFLSFANVPPPPPGPWSAAHKLLVAALRAGADCREEPQEGQALAAAAESLDIGWYVAVLARLHLNTFKVDGVFPVDWTNPMAAAAAMVQADSSSGSALYLLASLFNHSCEPCVNVTFPGNDGTAVFTAARHISAGEQLFISYTDTEQDVDVRQEYLAFAYGFRCGCPKCRDDIEQLSKGMPLHPH